MHVAVVRCGRLAGADYGVWSVSRNVNGPLMLALAEKIGYHDKGAIEMFRRGGPLVGLLPCSGMRFGVVSLFPSWFTFSSGNGTPLQPDLDDYLTEQELLANWEVINDAVRRGLKEDSLSRASMQSCIDDVRLGRMRKHTMWEKHCMPENCVVTPRFSIEQGLRQDGTKKFRPIDDFTKSWCNRATIPTERLRYDSLDLFMEMLEKAKGDYKAELKMFKIDIDAAFRRVPIKPAHRQFAWVGFLYGGRAHAFQHLSMPFGSIAAMHNWDRSGEQVSRPPYLYPPVVVLCRCVPPSCGAENPTHSDHEASTVTTAMSVALPSFAQVC